MFTFSSSPCIWGQTDPPHVRTPCPDILTGLMKHPVYTVYRLYGDWSLISEYVELTVQVSKGTKPSKIEFCEIRIRADQPQEKFEAPI